MSKTILAVGLLVAVILTSALPIARAQQENPCVIQDKLETLATIQKNANPDSPKNLETELRVRKAVLKTIIDCSLREVESLAANVNKVSGEPALEALRNRLREQLIQAQQYLDLQNDKINDLGVQAAKDTAKSIREWRQATYLPLTGKAANLILWAKNRDLLDVARSRYLQINQTIQSLKLSDQEEVQKLLNDAEENLLIAWKNHVSVKPLLPAAGTEGDVLAIIKKSLNALSQTYRDFFDLSELVKKIIPLAR